jgi:methyl-accepting chemotaxis protein
VLKIAMEKASQTIEGFAKVENAEAIARAKLVHMMMTVVIVISFVLLAGLSLVVRRHLVRPLTALGRVTDSLATGDYAQEIPGTKRGDELGAVARGLVVLRDAGRQKVVLEQANAESRAAQVAIVAALAIGLDNLRHGDFTKSIDGDFAPEYAVLQANFNHAAGELRAMIQTVNGITEGIRTGSDEIAQASEDLARRTQSNAASLEQTSAALAQIEGRLKAAASASHSSVARADQAMATVDNGRATADTALQAMKRVSGSAEGIDDVIEGLDKIAFQTRVLAMNAAVEAGRAGEAGRGFAVVADLVSALAMRAEEEAKRARNQLSITQSEIISAVDAVGEVDSTFTDISSDVDAVHKLLAGMASDNVAQSVAVTEISAAVGSMDRATQQNAAMVEETSAAARNLTTEVTLLAEQAAKFRVDDALQVTRCAPAPKSASPTSWHRVVAYDAKPNGHDIAADREWANF